MHVRRLCDGNGKARDLRLANPKNMRAERRRLVATKKNGCRCALLFGLSSLVLSLFGHWHKARTCQGIIESKESQYLGKLKARGEGSEFVWEFLCVLRKFPRPGVDIDKLLKNIKREMMVDLQLYVRS